MRSFYTKNILPMENIDITKSLGRIFVDSGRGIQPDICP
jgi:hypothetical protein